MNNEAIVINMNSMDLAQFIFNIPNVFRLRGHLLYSFVYFKNVKVE